MNTQIAISTFNRAIEDFPLRFLDMDPEVVTFHDKQYSIVDVNMRCASMDAAKRSIEQDVNEFGPYESFQPFVEFTRCGYTMSWPGREPVRREMTF